MTVVYSKSWNQVVWVVQLCSFSKLFWLFFVPLPYQMYFEIILLISTKKSTGISLLELYWIYTLLLLLLEITSWIQFSSVAQLCPTLCDHMDSSTPGLPIHHQLPEFTQTHVHWVSDAIQPSHLLLSTSPPNFNLSQHQGLFKCVSSSHEVAKYWSFSFNSILPMNIQDWLPLGNPNPRDSQDSSPTPQFKSINSLALNFLHSPTFTSIHDYWKNHSLD